MRGKLVFSRLIIIDELLKIFSLWDRFKGLESRIEGIIKEIGYFLGNI